VTLSIIVPSLNSGRFIRYALSSVLAQGAIDFEVIVHDGGSTDGTHEIIRACADERIRLITEPDDGQADALNRAVQRATGDWILWMNADDLLAQNAFAQAADTLNGSHDIVLGGWGLVDESGRLIKHYTPARLEHSRLLTKGAYVFSGSTFFRRELLLERGGFDPSLNFCMDYDLLLRVVPNARIAQIPYDVGYLRCHPLSKSNSQPWGFFREHWIVARRNASGSRWMLARLLIAQLKMAAYLLSRPVWRSPIWLWIRPSKRL
jgi:glycosyltransferase involved in cell wall biosynthesis